MKIFITFLFLFSSTALFSQNYKYTITLSDANEVEISKQFAKNIYEIFDQSAEFELITSQFTLLSNVDISEETFQQKMESLGFKRILFTKEEINNTIK